MVRRKHEFPLPAYRHLPGQNARPTDALLESIASQASSLDASGDVSQNAPWCYAIRLYNEAYFWEAHEVLEALWNCARPNSRERYLLQCLIQLSNARLKLELGQTKAAKRLKQHASDCFDRAFSQHAKPLLGIRPTELAMAIDLCDSQMHIQRLTIEQIP